MPDVARSSCIPAEQLGRVAALPAHDERRLHVARCLRCRVTRKLLARFRAPGARRLARVRGLVPRLDVLVESIVARPA